MSIVVAFTMQTAASYAVTFVVRPVGPPAVDAHFPDKTHSGAC